MLPLHAAVYLQPSPDPPASALHARTRPSTHSTNLELLVSLFDQPVDDVLHHYSAHARARVSPFPVLTSLPASAASTMEVLREDESAFLMSPTRAARRRRCASEAVGMASLKRTAGVVLLLAMRRNTRRGHCWQLARPSCPLPSLSPRLGSAHQQTTAQGRLVSYPPSRTSDERSQLRSASRRALLPALSLVPAAGRPAGVRRRQAAVLAGLWFQGGEVRGRQAQVSRFQMAHDGGLRVNGSSSGRRRRRWNDLIFGILFISQFAAYVAISVISLRALASSSGGGGFGQGGGTSLTLNSSTAYLLAIISGTGLILSICALGIVRMFPTFVLELSLLLSVLLSVAYAAYLWYVKYYSGAIIFTIVRPSCCLKRQNEAHASFSLLSLLSSRTSR